MRLIRFSVIMFLCFNLESFSKSINLDELNNNILMLKSTSVKERAFAAEKLIRLISDVGYLKQTQIKDSLISLFTYESNRLWEELKRNIKSGTFEEEERGEWFSEYIGSLTGFVDSLKDSKYIISFLTLTVECCNHPKTLLIYPDTTLRYIFAYLDTLEYLRKKLKTSYSSERDINSADGLCTSHVLGLANVLVDLLEKEKAGNYKIDDFSKEKIKNIGFKMAKDERWILRKVAVKILSYFPEDSEVVKKIEQIKNNDPSNFGSKMRGKRYPVREAAEQALKEIKAKQTIKSDTIQPDTKKN